MFHLLYMVALLLLAVTFGLSLAHALEFPGKLRLDEPTYRAVQAIYYPGFTIGGLVGEVGGMLVLAILLYLAPPAHFWPVAAALGLLLACHATYWLVTHPVNAAWLGQTELSGASALFFGLFSAPEGDWRQMRNVWEWSHVARAGFAMLSFLALTFTVTR